MRQPPLFFVTAIASLLLRCSESQTPTPTPSQTSTPLGAVFFDGTASQTAPIFSYANATVINSSWIFAVSFTVSEADPTCGPGRYSLTQVWLALSQGNGGASVNVQVQVFRADVSGDAGGRMQDVWGTRRMNHLFAGRHRGTHCGPRGSPRGYQRPGQRCLRPSAPGSPAGSFAPPPCLLQARTGIHPSFSLTHHPARAQTIPSFSQPRAA